MPPSTRTPSPRRLLHHRSYQTRSRSQIHAVPSLLQKLRPPLRTLDYRRSRQVPRRPVRLCLRREASGSHPGLMAPSCGCKQDLYVPKALPYARCRGVSFELIEALGAFSNILQWPRYFPQFFAGVSWVAGCLPGWFFNRSMKPFAFVGCVLNVSTIYPLYAGLSTMWLMMVKQVFREPIAHLQKHHSSKEEIRTVFDNNLNPNLEKGQSTPTVDEMVADAFSIFVAGTDITAHTMATIIWRLLNKL